MRKGLLGFALLLTLAGCKKGGQGTVKAFEPLHNAKEVALVPDTEIKDFQVKKLAKHGIKDVKIWRIASRIPAGDTVRREPLDEKIDPAMHFSTRITFGPISQAQFDGLKKDFGGLSQVTYNPDKKEWNLMDFMPPLIQALDGHRFVGLAEAMPQGSKLREFAEGQRTDPEVTLQQNCHATAYEVARSIGQ